MNDLEKKYSILKKSLSEMACIEDETAIKNTAERLQEYNYSPPFIFDVPNFINYKCKDAVYALKNIRDIADNEVETYGISKNRSVNEVKIIAMEMLYKEFSLLQNLRRDVPEAWDQINELYEDD